MGVYTHCSGALPELTLAIDDSPPPVATYHDTPPPQTGSTTPRLRPSPSALSKTSRRSPGRANSFFPTPIMRKPAWLLAAAVAVVAVTAAAAAAAYGGGGSLSVTTDDEATPAPPAAPLPNCTAPVGGRSRTYANCQALPGRVGGFALYWTYHDLNASMDILYAATTAVPGWAGFGFSDDLQMIGTHAVVGVTCPGCPTTAGVYKLGAKTPDGVELAAEGDAGAAAISGVSAERDGSVLRVAFIYSLQDGGLVSGFGPNGAVWAVGVAPAGGGLSRHGARAAGRIDFGVSDAEQEKQESLGDPEDVGAGAVEVQPDASAEEDTPPVEGEDDIGSDSSDDESAGSSPDASECFPSSATVQLADGGHVRMDELAVGDRVHVGGGRFSPVFIFSHANTDTVSTFVTLSTAAGPVLTLTPGHLLPVSGKGLSPARAVVVGDVLSLGPAATVSTVVRVGAVRGRGLWNPHTLDGAIVVDGVLASTWTTAVDVGLGRALLAPLAGLFQLVGAGGGWARLATAVARVSGLAGGVRDVLAGTSPVWRGAL